MAIFRGIGGAGEANDDATLNAVTEQAQDAAESASEAANSATAAANSASAAATSATNAAASESSVEADATAAASSASSAASSATSAASSATSAAASATTATTAVADIDTSVTAAETAQAAAEAAQTAAETAETNAETAETNAASSASSASTSASNASTSATAAAGSATTAASEASDAATSATAAASSATSAASSATTATTKASEAATSATNAAASETAAAASETAAAASESAAAASESAAATSETNAATSASNASTSETNAAASASSASTSATNAATSETNAASSASSAASAQSAAEAARDSALAAYDSFDDRYLGVKTSDPSLDNDGNALVSGALYFNSTDEKMRLYTGSSWVDAYTTGAGFLQISSNLSDLANAATARTNLGLGTAATTASTDYATAAQGTLADSATQPGDNVSTLTNDSGYITGNQTITLSGDVSGSGTTSIAVTVADDSHNHVISNVDGLQTALDGKQATGDYVVATGGTMTGDLSFGDNNKAIFGAGSDLQIFHSGSHSYIQDLGTGNLQFDSINGTKFTFQATNGTLADLNVGGSVDLYWNGSFPAEKKLATTSTGIDVTGTVTADGLTVDGDVTIDDNDATPLVIKRSGGADANTSIQIAQLNYDTYFGTDESGGFTVGRNADLSAQQGIKVDQNGDISFYEDTGTTPKFFWDASAESLGIGTTSPAYPLDVDGGSGPNVSRFKSSSHNNVVIEAGTSSLSQLLFADVNDADAGKISYEHANDAMAFRVNAAERMRIDSSGRVSLGQATPHLSLNVTENATNASGDEGIAFNYSDGTIQESIFPSRGNQGIVIGSRIKSSGITSGAFERTQDGIGYSAIRVRSGTGSYNHIAFYTDSTTGTIGDEVTSPNERMRITSSGNVGIGTSSPQRIFHTKSSVPAIRLEDSDVSGLYHELVGTAAGELQFKVDAGNVQANSALSFVVDGSERMRIDPSGNVGIGTTVPATGLDVIAPSGNRNSARFTPNGSNNAEYIGVTTCHANADGSGAGWESGGIGINIDDGFDSTTNKPKLNAVSGGWDAAAAIMMSPTNGSTQFYNVDGGSAGTVLEERMRLESDGDLHVDGDVIAYSTTISDERLKDNIVCIDGALDKVSQLNGYTFNYKADGKVSAGVIAQEVEKVLPEAVSEKELPLKADDGEQYKVVNYDALHGLLIEAIKELKAEIAELKAGK